MHDTQKFESHYLFKLLGVKTLGKEQDGEVKRVCAERSPLKNAKNIKAPVLVSESRTVFLPVQVLTRWFVQDSARVTR